MPKNIDEILQRYVNDLIQIYGHDLKSVILYGSYARGNFHEDSDIDIMILVDLSDEEIHQKGHALSDLTFDYNFDYVLAIMPIVKNQAQLPTFNNSNPVICPMPLPGQNNEKKYCC